MGFHTIVCIKAVMLEPPAKGLMRSPEALVLNPFDRPALEMALRMKEERGGTVTALSMGPDVCASSLFEAMAMGIDRAVLISDPDLAGSDTLATSTALAAAIKKLAPYDLLVFGTRTADSDTGQVGPQTTVLLDLPLVTWAHSTEQRDSGLMVERRADGFQETFELAFPAALTIHPASIQPRHVGLPGIELAFSEGKIETWALADLGLSADQVGWEGSPTRVRSWTRAARARKCEFISGGAEEQAEELVKRLAESGAME
jgi:electron transfer flavoprotein beta subunit